MADGLRWRPAIPAWATIGCCWWLADGPAVLHALDIGYIVLHRCRRRFDDLVERYCPSRWRRRMARTGSTGSSRPFAAAATIWRPGCPYAARLERLPVARRRLRPVYSRYAWGSAARRFMLAPVRFRSRRPLRPKYVVRQADFRNPQITLLHCVVSGQTLLRVNGIDICSALARNLSELTFTLPANAPEQVNDVRLRFGQTYPVESLASAPGLLVESAGLEAGNYAHIWLNGVDLAPNQRGYNLAILDSHTWQPRAVAAFDTHADPAAAAALVEFLRQMDDDSVLAAAVKDTASDHQRPSAQALAAWGLSDLQGRFRWSQAAIVLGANLTGGQRQVIEQTDGLQAASAYGGPGWRAAGRCPDQWLRGEIP